MAAAAAEATALHSPPFLTERVLVRSVRAVARQVQTARNMISIARQVPAFKYQDAARTPSSFGVSNAVSESRGGGWMGGWVCLSTYRECCTWISEGGMDIIRCGALICCVLPRRTLGNGQMLCTDFRFTWRVHVRAYGCEMVCLCEWKRRRDAGRLVHFCWCCCCRRRTTFRRA